MAENKIECTVKPGYLEINMTQEVAKNVEFFIKGFRECAKYTTMDEASKNLRMSQAIAGEFLEDPKLFNTIINDEFIGDDRNVPSYEVFLKKVLEKAIEKLKK